MSDTAKIMRWLLSLVYTSHFCIKFSLHTETGGITQIQIHESMQEPLNKETKTEFFLKLHISYQYQFSRTKMKEKNIAVADVDMEDLCFYFTFCHLTVFELSGLSFELIKNKSFFSPFSVAINSRVFNLNDRDH